MWPVDELRSVLPETLQACEDTDFVVLRCWRCGWAAWFSAAGATVEEMVRAARAHQCPSSLPLCDGCGELLARGEETTHARRCPRGR